MRIRCSLLGSKVKVEQDSQSRQLKLLPNCTYMVLSSRHFKEEGGNLAAWAAQPARKITFPSVHLTPTPFSRLHPLMHNATQQNFLHHHHRVFIRTCQIACL